MKISIYIIVYLNICHYIISIENEYAEKEKGIMHKKSKNTMSAKNKKTENISFKCTMELKRKIKDKADKFGVSDSTYIIECIEENLKRNTRGNKHKVKTLVEMQEAMNQFLISIDSENQEIKNRIIEISKGAMDLWDF